MTTIGDGGQFNAFYDSTLDKVVVEATLPDGSYAGWGWGHDMDGTEMIIFSADGASSSVSINYSVKEDEPPVDAAIASCYETSFV